MGGGPEAPSKQMSDKKELVLCALPFPPEAAVKPIALLKEEFNDVDLEYYYTPQQKPTTVPDGTSQSFLTISGFSALCNNNIIPTPW